VVKEHLVKPKMKGRKKARALMVDALKEAESMTKRIGGE